MNERIDAIFQQVLDEDCADPLYRFAELVRQDEREACAEIARFARMHAIADAIMKRGRNMSTKPENIDTSEECVHESDKSIHDLRQSAEMALEALMAWEEQAPQYWDGFDMKAVEALRQALAQPEKKWVGLENIDFQYQPPAEVITMKYAEAILKEKNT